MNYFKLLLITIALTTLGCVDDATDAEKYTKPTVNAGADQLHTLPKTSLTLKGSAKSYPKHLYKIKTTRWKQTSGPQQLAILNADSLTATLLKPTLAGTYEFELYAKDSLGRTNTDRVKIILQEPQVLTRARASQNYLDAYQVMWQSVQSKMSCHADIEHKWQQIYQAYWIKAAQVDNVHAWQQLLNELVSELTPDGTLRGTESRELKETAQVYGANENGIASIEITKPNRLGANELNEQLTQAMVQLGDMDEIQLSVNHSEPLELQALLVLMTGFTQQPMTLCIQATELTQSCHDIEPNALLEGKRIMPLQLEPESVLAHYLTAIENGELNFVVEPQWAGEITAFKP